MIVCWLVVNSLLGVGMQVVAEAVAVVGGFPPSLIHCYSTINLPAMSSCPGPQTMLQ
jgi:hypothetical protein